MGRSPTQSTKARAYIQDYILQKQLKENDPLPSESYWEKQIGVSRVTVRKALADLQETGVLKSVRGKGYFLQEKPVSAAKRPFPVVMHSASHAFGSIKLLEGITRCLNDHGYMLNLVILDADTATEESTLLRLYNEGFRHVLLFSADHPVDGKLFARLHAEGMCFTFAGNPPTYLSTDLVESDNIANAYDITAYLIRKGHRRIAWFASVQKEDALSMTPIRKRQMGFRLALEARGIPYDESDFFFWEQPDDPDTVRRIVSSERQYSAIVAVNDASALSLIYQLIHLGFRVPADYSVVGYDNIPLLYADNRIRLTTVEQPFFEIGYRAAELAVAHLENPARETCHLYLPGPVIEGETVQVLTPDD